jgi:fatty acid desaturase
MLITKIHNKYYDLSNFKHPGGDIPMYLSANRDATELFESHHIFSDREKIIKILEKYEVAEPYDNKIESNDIYDWEETLKSEFTRELKEIVREEIKYKTMKASSLRIIEMSSLFSIYLINLYYYLQGNNYGLLVYPLSLWMFTVNIYHDASHFALSHNPVINKLGTYTALMFSLTYNWYHQHIIGHHCYVNIESRDPDLYHSPKYVRHGTDIRRNKYHKIQKGTFALLWPLAVPLGLMLTGFMKTQKGKAYNKVVKLSSALNKASMYYEMLFVIMYMIIMPYIATGKIIYVVYPYLGYSVLFMICTQINHLTEDALKGKERNYYKHQIIASQNVGVKSYWTYLFTGGLNMQIEHHLLPSVNHCHLRKIQGEIEELCKRHNVVYNKSEGILDALYKHYRHIEALGERG